jgi:hypothetical protein
MLIKAKWQKSSVKDVWHLKANNERLYVLQKIDSDFWLWTGAGGGQATSAKLALRHIRRELGVTARREPTPSRCPVHDNQEHGAEAEELRSGIEALIESANRLPQSWGHWVRADDLQHLLDSTDARDSTAYLERQDAGAPSTFLVVAAPGSEVNEVAK